jgi:hypothetical protein
VVVRVCIRYTLQLGCVSLPKTATLITWPQLRDLRAQDYGEHSVFPVYSGK